MVLTAMAKPMFCAGALSPPLWATAVFMPTTWASAFTRGPPELPGLMGASVCSSPVRCSVVPERSDSADKDRPVADTMPSVTVGPPCRARALPMATTSSPTNTLAELPRATVGRLCCPSIWTRARSCAGSVPTTWAVRALVWPNRVTVSVLAPATTWLLVSTSPPGVRIMPVPAPSTSWPVVAPVPEPPV